MNIYELINDKKNQLLCEECLEFSKFDVCNYINEIICEEWECIDEGLGDTIKKKLKSGGDKIVAFAKKVINIINIILKKIQDIGRKLFERIKRVPNTTGTSNNTNNSKTSDTDNTSSKKKNITDEELYKKYGNEIKIKYQVPSKPNFLDFNSYFHELEGLADDVMTVSDKLSECDYDTRDKYKDKLDALQEKYGTGSLDGVKILSYKIFFSKLC